MTSTKTVHDIFLEGLERRLRSERFFFIISDNPETIRKGKDLAIKLGVPYSELKPDEAGRLPGLMFYPPQVEILIDDEDLPF